MSSKLTLLIGKTVLLRSKYGLKVEKIHCKIHFKNQEILFLTHRENDRADLQHWLKLLTQKTITFLLKPDSTSTPNRP